MAVTPSPFVQENTAHGIPGGAINPFQVGINDIDAGAIIETGVSLPWLVDPSLSWLEFAFWIETRLDPGIAIHRNLPQVYQDIDQLGTEDPTTSAFAASTQGGPNTVSVGKFSDTIQRMANSRYRFALVGRAVRMGYQPTIPTLKEIGGVPAIPDGEQMVIGPQIVGNYSGIPVYAVAWRIPYSVTVPPTKQQDPPTNVVEQIGAIAPDALPSGVQVPVSIPDSNSVRSGPNIDLLTGIARGAVQ